MKVVINRQYGGFGLSEVALKLYAEYKNITNPEWIPSYEFARDDATLISVIEKIGTEAASGRYATLKIVEIPDDVNWYIEEHDGMEWVAERHQTWK